jgi:tRNA1(Val) A37 N6-methylase TrmN6
MYGASYISFETFNEDYENINIITDLFVEDIRIKCVVDGSRSLYDMWHDSKNNIQNEIISSVKDKTDKHEIREAIFNHKSVKECSTYKPTLVFAFVKYFNAKRVLDLSSGWGDRLLGCMAAGVDVYHGYDPNPAMQPSYKKMIAKFAKRNQEVRVLQQPMEDVVVLKEYYDLFHTSPPFFDKEIYSKNKTQSTERYRTLDKWIVEFLFAYVTKGWYGLKKGGIFTIYIADTPKLKICDRMNDFILLQLGGVYMGVIGSKSGDRIFPCWCWKKI